MELAELYLCSEVLHTYRKAFLELQKYGHVSKGSDILSLNPILEKGLLKAGTRLTYACHFSHEGVIYRQRTTLLHICCSLAIRKGATTSIW